jgi:adenosylcobinamide-GDP ribazoletransferase
LPIAGPMQALLMALRFFSRLPTGRSPFLAPDLDRIALVLPVASVLIALPTAAALVLACWGGMPAYFAATLAVLLSAVTTGAMAEDAVADSMDGLFGGATAERRLEIMKDSRHGTYGVIALAGYLLLRVTALGAIAAISPWAAAGLLLASAIVARSGSLWLSRALPPARRDGLSAGAGRVSAMAFWQGMAGAAVLAAIASVGVSGPFGVVVALVAAGLVAWGWAGWCRRLVGGQTGDLIGALHALIEVTVLGLLVAFS